MTCLLTTVWVLHRLVACHFVGFDQLVLCEQVFSHVSLLSIDIIYHWVSLMAWRGVDRLHDSPWRPLTSTDFSHAQVYGEHILRPSLCVADRRMSISEEKINGSDGERITNLQNEVLRPPWVELGLYRIWWKWRWLPRVSLLLVRPMPFKCAALLYPLWVGIILHSNYLPLRAVRVW